MSDETSRDRTRDRGALARYFADLRRNRRLGRGQERGLPEAIERREPAALDALVERNLGFVVKIAAEYRGLGIPFEDLLNEGNLGLIEAARRFDPGKGVKFITYAIWWIRKAILQSISEHSTVVRLPYAQQRRIEKIRRAEARLRASLGREPTRLDLARELDLHEHEVEKAQQARGKPLSLARPAGEEGGATFEDFVPSGAKTQLERIIDRETRDAMERVFADLNEQQRTVIALRFGLGNERPLTLQEAGERLGVSRERVRQVEKQALAAMRRRIVAPAKRPDRRCG